VASLAAGVTSSAGKHEVIVILQMNLCASGFAGCYTGRSVQHAETLIKTHSPDVVTVNEICRDDVAPLQAAVQGVSAGWTVVAAFHAIPDRPTGRATRCRDGQDYGVGLVARFDRPTQTVVSHGTYPVQDKGDPEQRVWVCLRATGRFIACTTHLAIDASTAFTQCGYLLGIVVPTLWADSTQPGRALIGGDFNLGRDGRPGLRGCTPPGYVSTTDGGLQHLVATMDFTVLASTPIDMAGTTDHPGLLVTVGLGEGVPHLG
jgi:hypothetical protein